MATVTMALVDSLSMAGYAPLKQSGLQFDARPGSNEFNITLQ